MSNSNGLSGIIVIFGLVLGVFLAVIGISLVQDLVITMNLTGETTVSNPIPIVNWFIPEVSSEVTSYGEVTIMGLGLVLLVSLLMLVFIIIFIVFIIFLLIPPLASAGLGSLLFFSIFFLTSFMLSYFLGLQIVSIFL